MLISLDYHQREQVRAEHRDYASKGLAWYDNELDTGPNDGIAAQRLATGNSFLPLNAGGIASTTGFGLIGFTDGGAPILGYMPIGDLGVLTFDETGQALPFESGNCQGIRCENGMGFTTHEYAVLSTPTERSLFFYQRKTTKLQTPIIFILKVNIRTQRVRIRRNRRLAMVFSDRLFKSASTTPICPTSFMMKW